METLLRGCRAGGTAEPAVSGLRMSGTPGAAVRRTASGVTAESRVLVSDAISRGASLDCCLRLIALSMVLTESDHAGLGGDP